MGRSKVNRRSKKVRGGAELTKARDKVKTEFDEGDRYIKLHIHDNDIKEDESNKKTVSIATYNTSFASDLGLAIGSEKHFIKRMLDHQKKSGEDDPREYFKYSITFAREWCLNTDDWGAIGFQEMNIPEKVGKEKGSIGIDYTFEELKGKERLRGVSGANKVIFNSRETYPCLLTVWKPSVFGELKDSFDINKCIYLAEMESAQSIDGYGNEEDKTIVGENYQKGRPILILLTEHNGKNYLLVNLHAPNRSPAKADKQIRLVKHYIKNHVKMAMEQFGIKNLPNEHCFIMGDYNGPLDKIMMSLEGEDKPEVSFSAFEKGHSVENLPNSCCYNFNSSCPEELASDNFRRLLDLPEGLEGKPFYVGKLSKDEEKYKWAKEVGITLTNDNFKQVEYLNLEEHEVEKKVKKVVDGEEVEELVKRQSADIFEISNNPIECVIIRSDNLDVDESMGGNARSMKSRGRISNYRLVGDMVLGANVAETAKMYPESGPEDVSVRSDHEMVYVRFNLPETKGGSRTKRTKQLRKKRSKQLRKKRSKQLKKKRSQKLSRR